MVYVMLIHTIYLRYTWHLNVYPSEIFCIYSLNLFDMPNICIVYAMRIHTIYL